MHTSARPTAFLAKNCHCEASAHTGCGNPSPVPSVPLPKGSWHGEAMTGGFFSAPHLLLRSVGADDPVAVPKIFALPYGGRLKF